MMVLYVICLFSLLHSKLCAILWICMHDNLDGCLIPGNSCFCFQTISSMFSLDVLFLVTCICMFLPGWWYSRNKIGQKIPDCYGQRDFGCHRVTSWWADKKVRLLESWCFLAYLVSFFVLFLNACRMFLMFAMFLHTLPQIRGAFELSFLFLIINWGIWPIKCCEYWWIFCGENAFL